MITPRQTRLVRAADLHVFRSAIGALVRSGDAPLLVVVPTRGGARQLQRSVAADAVTRDELYDRFHARLRTPPRRASAIERDVIMQSAARAVRGRGSGPPFRVRPGLVAEILRLYDQLRRQAQQVDRFEELIEQALSPDADVDRGAARMLGQTRFLAATFRRYEQTVRGSNLCDEHVLRAELMATSAEDPIRHVIVTVPDWIADPDGLFVADFDLLSRIPGLARIDLVATDALLGSGFHERVHGWLPGVEEASARDIGADPTRVRPTLVTPAASPDVSSRAWHTYRDREEELIAVARRVEAARVDAGVELDRVGVVFKQPLPYLYLARETLGAAGLPSRTADALPLAIEPTAAALDLVLEFVSSGFTRDAIVALLRSPHFAFTSDGQPISREAVAALDRALSERRYIGDRDHLAKLDDEQFSADALPALRVAIALSRELGTLTEQRLLSAHLDQLTAWLDRSFHPLGEDDAFGARERRARAALLDALGELSRANAAYGDPEATIEEVRAAVRRWIEEHTFAPPSSDAGLHLLNDQSARYADLDDVTIVGLIEGEWPQRPRRNIFYPPALLKALGWPSEKDRRAADEARFVDLLGSARRRVVLSTFTLDEDALVEPSSQLDVVPAARLSTAPEEVAREEVARRLQPSAEEGSSRRLQPGDDPGFHGYIGAQPPRVWSVSALETYLGCPFRFFAQHVLRLKEEPEDEEVMDPKTQGLFVHEVFETFFRAWHDAGGRTITPATLDDARRMFADVVDKAIERLPPAEGALERTRLLGSSAAAGLGEAVLRMEAERATPVVDRLLEQRLDGELVIKEGDRERTVSIRGKADRLDLLADGTFRLIDYKLGWPPQRGRALQLPIYGLRAEQQLGRDRGRRWTLGEAMYLAFKGPRRVVPLFTSPADRDKVLEDARERLAKTLAAIERGEFPPTPDDVFRCESCSYAPVCRKDYVGDV